MAGEDTVASTPCGCDAMEPLATARPVPPPAATDVQHGQAGHPLTIEDIARLAGVSTKTVSRVLNHSPVVSDTMRARVEAVIETTGFVPNAQARALALRRNFLVVLLDDGRARGIAEAVEDGLHAAMAQSDHALLVHRVAGPEPPRPCAAIAAVPPPACDGESPGQQAAPLRQDALEATGPSPPDTAAPWTRESAYPPPQGGDDAGLASLRRFLARHRPAAVITLPPVSGYPEIAEICAEAGVVCLRLGATRDGDGLAGPEREAMAEAVSSLVAAGHRRIALVSGPEGWGGMQAREMGYLDAMADHGFDRGPSLIEPGDGSHASGRVAAHLLLELSPRPSAIVACSDAMAAGVLQAAHERGLAVPGELSVIGFDDSALAAMTAPPLSSVRIDWRALGERAFARIAGAPTKRAQSDCLASRAGLGTCLVERGSSAPPAANARARRHAPRQGSVPPPSDEILRDPPA